MEILLLALALIVMIFGFVVLFGAPYLPTTKKQIDTALELLDLKKGQRLLELGAGDGSVALEALRRGLKVTAIELNPILCLIIYLRTYRYRSNILIIWGSFWQVKWGDYDGIYAFLLDKFMERLDKKIIQENKSVKFASFAFRIPDKQIEAERDGVFLYSYVVS